MEKVDLSVICRWLMTALGGVLTTLEPTLPYILICTVVILFDCYTAWQLSRRVKKAHPDKTKPDSGKFNSHNAGKVLDKNLEGFDACPIEKIDIEEEDDLVEKHKIMSVPTLILVDADGNQVWRHTGTLTADELRRHLDPYLCNTAKA